MNQLPAPSIWLTAKRQSDSMLDRRGSSHLQAAAASGGVTAMQRCGRSLAAFELTVSGTLRSLGRAHCPAITDR